MFAVTLAAGIGLGLSAAQAANLSGSSLPGSDPIVKVEGGCGPGGHRDRFGYCRPNGYYAPPPPPRYYRCPPYMHPTPYGCRRDY